MENQIWASLERLFYARHLVYGSCSINSYRMNQFSSSNTCPVKHKSHEMLHNRETCPMSLGNAESRFFFLLEMHRDIGLIKALGRPVRKKPVV